MTVDRYTKIVLTVIAGSLLWICVMGVPPAVHAQQNMTFQNGNGPAVPVVVVGAGMLHRDGNVTVMFHGDRTDPWLPVQLPYTAANPLPTSLPYTPANPLPARLPYTPEAPMPIELASVRKVTSWDAVRVVVEDAALRSKPGIGREGR